MFLRKVLSIFLLNVPGTFYRKIQRGLLANVRRTFRKNIKRIFVEKVPMEGSRNLEYSFWTFLERFTGKFEEHCFGTFKKPGQFLSFRNVSMEPSERSMGTFREGMVLWGQYLSNDKLRHIFGKNQLILLLWTN